MRRASSRGLIDSPIKAISRSRILFLRAVASQTRSLRLIHENLKRCHRARLFVSLLARNLPISLFSGSIAATV